MTSKKGQRTQSGVSEPENSLMLSELKLLREQINNIQIQLTSITEKYDQRIAQLEDKVSIRDNEILSLKANVVQLQESENRQAQDNLTNEIELVGLPESPNENLFHIVKTAACKLGLSLDECDVDWISRVGPRSYLY